MRRACLAFALSRRTRSRSSLALLSVRPSPQNLQWYAAIKVTSEVMESAALYFSWTPGMRDQKKMVEAGKEEEQRACESPVSRPCM